MKLLIDMNLSPRWVNILAASGVEAVHWSTLGAFDAPDYEIMAYAAAHDLVVFTHDLDFSAILAATQHRKPSVIQIRGDDINPDTMAAKVVSALKTGEADLASGALLTIDDKRSRLRILPLTDRG